MSPLTSKAASKAASSAITCLKTLTRYTPIGTNKWSMALLPQVEVYDVEKYTPSVPHTTSIPPLSPLFTLSHTSFRITAADEMYHTQWDNWEGELTVNLSPVFKWGKVEKVLVEKWDTFEAGDEVILIEGVLNE
ncbi:hypothetical protein TrVE_jg6179 [Triparma verrucosa]|uniref:Uncharacterized protein n=1 Tax=Triparma verrucosa TaxID=1606542 RepID=A0A9W7BNU9_9STRA|nr:hypothetical protein TrVE_jg6179 [Triparma verrucosa]